MNRPRLAVQQPSNGTHATTDNDTTHCPGPAPHRAKARSDSKGCPSVAGSPRRHARDFEKDSYSDTGGRKKVLPFNQEATKLVQNAYDVGQ